MRLYRVDNANGCTLKVMAENKTDARKVANEWFKKHDKHPASGAIGLIAFAKAMVVETDRW